MGSTKRAIMAQVLHGSAHTTAAVRRAIQNSQASVRSLAKQYGINPKTVAKWKQRSDMQDAPMGSKQPHSTVLSTEEEALIVAFRKHTLLLLEGGRQHILIRRECVSTAISGVCLQDRACALRERVRRSLGCSPSSTTRKAAPWGREDFARRYQLPFMHLPNLIWQWHKSAAQFSC